jgi:hypothetical protein
MKNSIYSLVFITLISLGLTACETAKVSESPTNTSAGTTDSKTATATTSGKSTVDNAPLNATPNVPAVKPPEPVAPAVVKPEQLFSEGKELYEKGDYRGAIRKLTSARDASDESPAVKQNSLKYLAFSYCVTSQRPLCKTQFSSLLKLSPTFELSRGEAGHPLWGPVFKEAKAGVAKPTK